MSEEKLTHRMTKSLYLSVNGKLQEVTAGTLIGPKLGAGMAKAGHAISLADEKNLADEAEKASGTTPPPPPPPAGPNPGTKDWIIAELTKAGIQFDASANKAELEALLPKQ